MRLKYVISVILLTVYSIVLAHNFIPHHHHFEISLDADFACHAEKEHKQCTDGFSLHDDDMEGHTHNSCNFNEKIILTKLNNLPALYLPVNEVEIVFSEPAKQLFAESYFSIQLPDWHPRHIQLRGPPRFL
jgi:hypothetical protein